MNTSANTADTRHSHTALVLAGGGIMGAAYEIGCLTALDQCFGDGFSCNGFDSYIGVSAGSAIAALMASGVSPEMLFRAVANEEDNAFNWRRKDIYQFDMRAQFLGFWRLLRNVTRILRRYRHNRWDLSRREFGTILQEQFPAGLFSLEPLRDYLLRAFAQGGVPERIDQLRRRLFIPAYDLDSGSRVVFGGEGFRHVPVCDAIVASSAIPFFFQPVTIDGRHYIDGTIGRVSHLDVAIAQGARLILVVNPRVPMNNNPEHICLPSLSTGKCTSISELGIACAWEQSQRIENKVKLDMALEAYRREHPEVDILLFEPAAEESMLFFQSPMSQVARHHVMTHGYHLTLGQFDYRMGEYSEVFHRHGIALRTQRPSSSPPVV